MDRIRHRSVGYLDHEGDRWACFLVTFQERDGSWKGYFSFRQVDVETTETEEQAAGGMAPNSGDDEVRTADIFVERSETEILRGSRSSVWL